MWGPELSVNQSIHYCLQPHFWLGCYLVLYKHELMSNSTELSLFLWHVLYRQAQANCRRRLPLYRLISFACEVDALHYLGMYVLRKKIANVPDSPRTARMWLEYATFLRMHLSFREALGVIIPTCFFIPHLLCMAFPRP